MLKIQGIDIYFKHKPDEWGYTTNTVNGREVKTQYKGVTTCFIEQTDSAGEVVAQVTGHSYCGLADKFEKTTGRKIALSRALVTFNEEFRKEVWEQYLAKTK